MSFWTIPHTTASARRPPETISPLMLSSLPNLVQMKKARPNASTL